jgi:ATP-dependent DNA ligase
MAACIDAESAVLDGEIVYLGADGRPEFYGLMRRRRPQHMPSPFSGWTGKISAGYRW